MYANPGGIALASFNFMFTKPIVGIIKKKNATAVSVDVNTVIIQP